MAFRTSLVIVAMCGAASAEPATKTVKVAPFGDVSIDDGALVLMDRGTGDKRIHYMSISHDFRGVKSSRDDVAGAKPKTDSFPIDADERAAIKDWTEQLWKLAPHGRKSYRKVRPKTGDFFEWAIVVRRGDAVRVIEGGVNGSGAAHQADFLESPLDFLDMHF